MLISLVVVRLELADDCLFPAGFQSYCAPSFCRDVVSTTFSQAEVNPALLVKDHSPAHSSYSLPSAIIECRGSRNNEDIYVQFLTSNDIQIMENDNQHKNVISGMPTDGSVQHSSDSTPSDITRAALPVHRRRRARSFVDRADCDEDGPVPQILAEQCQLAGSPMARDVSTVHFISGNPSVELVKGILHIYKNSQMTSLEEGVARSEMLCMMAIPCAYTIHDLLRFTAPLNGTMDSMQVLRGSSRNNYLLLMTFRNQACADEFYTSFNSLPFNSIEEDLCHLVYVARVEIIRESEGGSLPIAGLTELPHCPVCLERMEESVNGVLTVLCNHSFHVSCLSQWTDTTCPVCRFCQTPEEVPDQWCMQCGSQESLWICLICGCIGCGRYVGLHAYKHFQETNHTYAMELGTNHVWDYAGDNYVHRLVQNKSDGKLVHVEGQDEAREEKMDSIALEYTYLLTTQLESQRQYYKQKILQEAEKANRKVSEMEDHVETLGEEKSNIKARLTETLSDKQSIQHKYSQIHSRLSKVLGELQEEKDMNKFLRDNQQLWVDRVNSMEANIKTVTNSKDNEIADLNEQLRDVMFYLEAQQKLSTTTTVSQEEIQASTVVVGASVPPSDSTGKKRSKKHR